MVSLISMPMTSVLFLVWANTRSDNPRANAPLLVPRRLRTCRRVSHLIHWLVMRFLQVNVFLSESRRWVVRCHSYYLPDQCAKRLLENCLEFQLSDAIRRENVALRRSAKVPDNSHGHPKAVGCICVHVTRFRGSMVGPTKVELSCPRQIRC